MCIHLPLYARRSDTPPRVNLKVTSIAPYLPSRGKDDIPFVGTVSGAMAKGMRPTPNDEILSAARQTEEQQDDAKTRNLAWSTEDDIEETDEDAEGEPDTGDAEYVLRADGTYEKIVEVSTGGTSHEKFAPVGIRNEDGEIEALPEAPVSVETQQEAHFAGVAERIPTRLREIVRAACFHHLVSLSAKLIHRTPETFPKLLQSKRPKLSSRLSQ